MFAHCHTSVTMRCRCTSLTARCCMPAGLLEACSSPRCVLRLRTHFLIVTAASFIPSFAGRHLPTLQDIVCLQGCWRLAHPIIQHLLCQHNRLWHTVQLLFVGWVQGAMTGLGAGSNNVWNCLNTSPHIATSPAACTHPNIVREE